MTTIRITTPTRHPTAIPAIAAVLKPKKFEEALASTTSPDE